MRVIQKKLLFALLAIILIVGLAITVSRLNHSTNNPDQSKPGTPPSPESLVTFPNEEAKKKFLRANNLSESDLSAVPGLDNTYVVPVPNNELKADGATVAPRREYKALLTPNDTIYPQWYTNNISAPAAWDTSTGSSLVSVAVIDTGFGLNHEDMANRWVINSGEFGAGKESNGIDDDGNGKIDDWRGWDFAQNDNNPNAGSTNPSGQGVSHGTTTSGLVGATGNNAKGVASVNWGATILPLQALDDNGVGYTDNITAAVNYAVARGAKVIGLSLGSTGADPTLETAINNAVSAGVVVIAAAGNCGDSSTYALNGCDFVGQMLYPAKYQNVIAVGATDQSDNRASFSSYGPELGIVAPGSGTIQSPSWSQANQTTLYTSSANGTSFAAPIVAGIAALYKGLVPAAPVSEITQVLENSADKVSGMGGQNFTNYYGYGRVNAEGVTRLASIIHPDGTLVRNTASGAVYLIENGQKRYIPDPTTFLSHYTDVLAQAKTATPRDLGLTNSTNLAFRSGVVIKGSGLALYAVNDIGGTLYKQYIPSPAVHNTLGFVEAERVQVSDSFLSSLPDGATLSIDSQHPNGCLVIAPDNITVYLLDNGQMRHVSNPWVLMSLNKSKNFSKPATATDMALPAGTPVDFEEGAIIKGSGSDVFVVDNNSGFIEKRHIVSSFIYSLLDYQNNEWINVPDNVLPAQTGPSIN